MNAVHASRIHRSVRCRLRLGWRCDIALLLGLLPAAALACTQPPGGTPHYTIAQHVRAADVVLKGMITQVMMDNYNYTATVQVQEYFKANGPASVTITNFGTGADCRSFVKQGDTWIFFADGDPDAELKASYLSEGDAIASPSADTIAQILAVLNSRPRAYLPLLLGGTNIAASAPISADDRALIGLVFVVVGAVSVWLRFAARWM
jgi:hypothetical protein